MFDGLISFHIQTFINRNLEPILPTEISSSYRMIMNRDFKNVVDDYSIINEDKMSANDKKSKRFTYKRFPTSI